MTEQIIEKYPDYAATSEGDIISLKWGRRRKLKLSKVDSRGYLHVTLSLNRREVTERVHRLIAQTFIPNPKEKPQVNHKNGVKRDNRAENLEWCTASENALHSFRVLGRVQNKPWRGVARKDHPQSKPVTKLTLAGNVVGHFDSARSADDSTPKACYKHISDCCRGSRETHAGFLWQFTKGD